METKKKDTMKQWLLGFSKHIGSDVVVSLLVTKSEVVFLNAMDKKRYLGEQDDGSDEEPAVRLPISTKIEKGYIG